MIFLPKFDADAGDAPDAAATALMGVPTFYTRLLRCPRLTPGVDAATCACSSPARRRCWPRRIASGGAAPGTSILERYGMTETNMNTSNPYDGDRVRRHGRLPLPGVNCAHRSETGKELPRARSA
jgi:malonyl-CoA/methylmalonyl-CoA synthetase